MMNEKEYDKLLRDAHLLGEFERKHPNPELKSGKCADCWNYEDNGGPCCGDEDGMDEDWACEDFERMEGSL